MTNLLKPNDNGLASLDDVRAWMEAQSQDTIEEKVAKNTSDGWEGFGKDYGLFFTDKKSRLYAMAKIGNAKRVGHADIVLYERRLDALLAGFGGQLYRDEPGKPRISVMSTSSDIVSIIDGDEITIAEHDGGVFSLGGEEYSRSGPLLDITKFNGKKYYILDKDGDNPPRLMQHGKTITDIINPSNLSATKNALYFTDGGWLTTMSKDEIKTVIRAQETAREAIFAVEECTGTKVYFGDSERHTIYSVKLHNNTFHRIHSLYCDDLPRLMNGEKLTERTGIRHITIAPIDFVRRMIEMKESNPTHNTGGGMHTFKRA